MSDECLGHSLHLRLPPSSGLLPAEAQALVYEKAATALVRLAAGEFAQQVAAAPQSGQMNLDISIKNYRPVEMLGTLPTVERLDSHTVRFVVDDVRLRWRNVLAFHPPCSSLQHLLWRWSRSCLTRERVSSAVW